MSDSIGQRFYDEDRGIHQEAEVATKPLSMPQLRALKCLRDNVPTDNHCRSQSDYGGLSATMLSLYQRRLIDKENNLTDRGRRAIERADLRAQKAAQKPPKQKGELK